MDAFLGYWKPNWIVIMESELWPNLIIGASKCGVSCFLLCDACMYITSFWTLWGNRKYAIGLFSYVSDFFLLIPIHLLNDLEKKGWIFGTRYEVYTVCLLYYMIFSFTFRVFYYVSGLLIFYNVWILFFYFRLVWHY